MNIVLAIIIFLVYTIALCVKGGGIPSSLSASVFTLPLNRRWIWTIVLYAVCFLCIPTIIDKTSENTQFLAFIAIASLAFVGAAPLVKDTQDIAYKVHCLAAVICALCSQFTITFNCFWLLFIWVAYLGIFVYHVKSVCKSWNTWNTKVFWAEMICFANTFIYCLI